MPKTRLQNIIFTLIMAFVMVYAMVCYNIALDKGGMTNEIFLLAFHEIPIMWPIACILEYFAVEKLSRKLAFRMVSPEDKPIFAGETKVYNSTVNDVLARHCRACGISEISIHGLRHTHASLLLFAGVSIASVARRLGHASMTTTQKTYLHIIQELENKDVDLVMRTLSGL